MGRKQIVGWLALWLLQCALTGGQTQQNNALSFVVPPGRLSVRPCNLEEPQRETSDAPPAALIRRVALIFPPQSTEPRVLEAVNHERAMRSKHRRRLPLFIPGLPKASGRSPAKGQKGAAGQSKGPESEPEEAPDLSPEQLHAVGDILFAEALVEKLQTNLNLQMVLDTDVETALTDLHLSRSAINSPANAEKLNARLNCDAIIVPEALRLRMREGESRDLALWTGIRVYRSMQLESHTVNDASGIQKEIGRKTAMPPAEYPSAGAASSDRAPFQSHYLKAWPQLVQEAGNQAASIAVRTFATGIVAPLTRQGEKVALTPVVAPIQADALIFKAAGRMVMPNALKHLPSDVSSRFHPNLLPLFDNDLIHPEAVKRTLRALHITPDALWTKEELPNIPKARLLGSRTKADYLLMARIGDLELAQEMGAPGGTESSRQEEPEAQMKRASISAQGRPSERMTARAEAIGAFVRVSDGAVLWHERTTATSASFTSSANPEGDSPAARRAVSDAVHFALLQLERRFRQYRSRYER
jgi:hypothetical protein